MPSIINNYMTLSTLGAGKTWAEANRLEIIEKNNISIGILAFCEAEFGVMVHENEYGVGAYINHYKTNQLIQNSKKQVDFLVVIIHAGVELIDLPLPEWRYRYKELCDLGADAVIGHHPHVPQGWENYNGKPIFYSLGNFYFDKEVEIENQGLSVCLSFNEDGTSSYEIIPHQKKNGVVYVSDDKQYVEWLNSLCAKLGENYFDEIESITMELYKKRYKHHFQKSVKGYHNEMRIIKKIKRIFSQIILPRKSLKENNLLLLHNIRIESHRYVMQRALHILYENNEQHNE